MQKQDSSISPSRTGVLVVTGFDSSLRVDRGHLIVRTVVRREVLEARLPRVSRPRLRRLLIVGSGGYVTWEALAWLDGIGATFAHLSRSGRILAASAELGPDQPALRRAQVLSADTETGLEITRYLLGQKIEGQLSILKQHFAYDRAAVDAATSALERVRDCRSTREALAAEARAASAYWRAWADLQVTFARADLQKIPEDWLRFGDRHSPLSASPKNAAAPAGAILNYLYALAEFECRLALLALGLDPGLGWAHRDAPYRDSAALDLLEAVRPVVDRYVIGLLAHRTFSRQEFIELPTGQVRLAPALAKSLAESTLASWEKAVAPFAEDVARLIAAAALAPVHVPSRSTRGARGKGRGSLGRRSPRSAARPRRIAAACRECGLILDRGDRAYCDECLPKFETERTKKLVGAARAVLAEMRAAPVDPAQTPPARAKRSASVAARMQEAARWDRENPEPHDPQVFKTQVLPGLQHVTLPQIVKATGLTSAHCWRIRRGERIPHPRHWEALSQLASAMSRSG